MKKISFLIIFIILISIKFSFSQGKIGRDKTPTAFVMRLDNGKETPVINHPIYLLKQIKNISAYSQKKDSKGRNVILLLLNSSVKRILSLEDIFREHNINLKNKNDYFINTGVEEKMIPIKDGLDIYATENSIESVTVDENNKHIIIKTYKE